MKSYFKFLKTSLSPELDKRTTHGRFSLLIYRVKFVKNIQIQSHYPC